MWQGEYPVSSNMASSSNMAPYSSSSRVSGFFCGVRARPCARGQSSILSFPSSESVVLNDPAKAQNYNVDVVFPENASDAEVYEFVRPLILKAAAGGTTAIIAYGQTGSGKTHTISHMAEYMAMDLFQGGQNQVTITTVELLGDKLTDLLIGEPVRAREMPAGKDVLLQGAQPVTVNCSSAFQMEMQRALSRRKTAVTGRHDESSRSHALFQFRIVSANGVGRLNLVDLAGSERDVDQGLEDPKERKLRQQEAIQINKSLSALQACLRANEGGTTVPFRQNKLTMLLKDSFSYADAATVFLSCVNPGSADAGPTKNTLRYTSGVKAMEKERKVATSLDRPRDWDKRAVAEFIRKTCARVYRENGIEPSQIPNVVAAFPFSGPQLLSLSPDEFITRCGRQPVGDALSRTLHDTLKELEARGILETGVYSRQSQQAPQSTAAGSNAFYNSSNQDLETKAKVGADTIRTYAMKLKKQEEKHHRALADTKAYLLEDVQRLEKAVRSISACSRAKSVKSFHSVSDLQNWVPRQTKKYYSENDLSGQITGDLETFCTSSQRRIQELTAAQKRMEKEFVKNREELETIGKSLSDSLMEQRDTLLSGMSSNDHLPSDVKGYVREFEENKQSWDDFWGKS